MGNPASPVIANIFLCNFEKLFIDSCPNEFKPKFYKRYVDDTFLIFDNETQSKQFHEYINSKHPNINFTIEKQNNNSLSFLDINIKNVNDVFITNVYRKPTFTGLGTNFFSCTPLKYKINAISTLVNRAYNLCTSYVLFDQEIQFLYNYFNNNSYSFNSVSKLVNSYLNKKYNQKNYLYHVHLRR